MLSSPDGGTCAATSVRLDIQFLGDRYVPTFDMACCGGQRIRALYRDRDRAESSTGDLRRRGEQCRDRSVRRQAPVPMGRAGHAAPLERQGQDGDVRNDGGGVVQQHVLRAGGQACVPRLPARPVRSGALRAGEPAYRAHGRKSLDGSSSGERPEQAAGQLVLPGVHHSAHQWGGCGVSARCADSRERQPHHGGRAADTSVARASAREHEQHSLVYAGERRVWHTKRAPPGARQGTQERLRRSDRSAMPRRVM